MKNWFEKLLEEFNVNKPESWNLVSRTTNNSETLVFEKYLDTKKGDLWIVSYLESSNNYGLYKFDQKEAVTRLNKN